MVFIELPDKKYPDDDIRKDFANNNFTDREYSTTDYAVSRNSFNQSEYGYENATTVGNSSEYASFLVCTTVIEINALFTFLSVILMFITSLASIGDLLFFVAVCKTKTMPINVKIILANLASACILLTVSLLFQSIFNLVVQSAQFPSVSIYRCSWMQSPRILSGSAVSSFMLVICMERVVVSRRAVTGIDQSKLSLTVVGLTLFGWIWSIFNIIISVRQNFAVSATVHLCFCDCTLLSFPFFTFVTYLKVFVPVEVIVVLLFWTFWLYYRKTLKIRGMNTAQHNLSERVTIMDVIFTTNVLLPTITLHALCVVCFALCTTIANRWRGYTRGLPWGMVFVELGQICMACFCLFLPAICFRLNAGLGKSLYSIECLANVYEFLINGALWSTNRKQRKYATDDRTPPVQPTIAHLHNVQQANDGIKLERMFTYEEQTNDSNSQSEIPVKFESRFEQDSVPEDENTVANGQKRLSKNNVIFVKPQVDE